jgi:multidrug efflux pump subunit AcrB
VAHKNDSDYIAHCHNTARFFVEKRILAWAALIVCMAWGVYGYFAMPQRKDPDIPVRVAVVTCQWPGATAQQVEQLVTRPIEETIAQNKWIHNPTAEDYGIQSLTLPGQTFVTLQLADNVGDTRVQLNDINLKLQNLNSQLPQGAGPIQFQSEFGDTAALMLTVASPRADAVEVHLRAQSIERAIAAARAGSVQSKVKSTLKPASLVFGFPKDTPASAMEKFIRAYQQSAEANHLLEHSNIIEGPGFIGLDGETASSDEALTGDFKNFVETRLQPAEINPDIWPMIVVRNAAQIEARLGAVAGAKYSYVELDRYTDLISRSMLGIPQASRVQRKGVLPQAVYLEYAPERLAANGLQVTDLSKLLNARNITSPAGMMEAGNQNVRLNPSGQFEDAASIGDVVVSRTQAGAPVYLRDLVRVYRSYQSPATYLNYYSWVDKAGQQHRDRAITVAVFMRSGEQVQKFGKAVDERMKELKNLLPPDLILSRTSDQPLQVRENIDLFMDALYEAIALVVLVALIGFWEWRSALLMALSIPITLALTFAFAHLMQVDLQQVSIASLIIALGLLVDDPVVANDAIKRDLAIGHPPLVASWLGPTKLARAIMYATVTNIVAYLPLAALPGTTGDFIWSLPLVMTASLVASRLVSMTFIPLLGYYLLRPSKKKQSTLEERRVKGFYGFYYRVASHAIEHRWYVLAGSFVFLLAGLAVGGSLKSQFFPTDVQYWSYADVWLPNNAPLSLTDTTAKHAEEVIIRELQSYEHEHPEKQGALLKNVTTFVGGGGPRFWFSASPQQQQSNYAEVLIQLSNKDVTPKVAGRLQEALSREIPGAFIIMNQLQSNPVQFPIEIRLSSVSDIDPKDEPADIEHLRRYAGQLEAILRSAPGVLTVQNDWYAESPSEQMQIATDKANLSGVTNRDVANSTQAALSGTTVTALREGNDQIPVIARMTSPGRVQLSDMRDLYVYPSSGAEKIPLRAVSSVSMDLQTERILRMDHFRTIGVHAWPQPGVLNSEVLSRVNKQLDEFNRQLPPSYRMVIGGEKAKQKTGFRNLTFVLGACVAGIYLALLLQFNNPIKPLLVFAATPYGVVGALFALWVMGTPFGFMAFLGITSLVGVIVSHVIVLFDFIEEMREKGEPFEQAICDAGIERLRPVMITVGATILALFPLASHGGPLWQPLCYAQIGGLAAATFITLLLVPVIYSIAVLDWKIIRWETETVEEHGQES